MTKQINQILNFLKGEFDLEETEDVAQNHQDVVLKRKKRIKHLLMLLIC